MLQQHIRLKNFTVEFVREVKICAQYSSTAYQNKTWWNLNILTINAKKRQKQIKKNIKFMERKWSDETMNQLMLEIKNYHVANETVKFIKKYFINFEKTIKKLQLTIFKYKKRWIETFKRLLFTFWTISNAFIIKFILIFLRRFEKIFALLIW